MNQIDTNQPEGVSEALVTETLNIFLALSWVFEKYTQDVAKSTKTEKRKIFFAPLDISLGFASTDPIQDSKVRTCLLCTQILKFIGNHHAEYLQMSKYENVLSSELYEIITDRHFCDQCVLVKELLVLLPEFYVPAFFHNTQYWKCRADLYAFRASQAYVARKDWVMELAKLLFHKHAILKKRNLKAGVGLVSVFV